MSSATEISLLNFIRNFKNTYFGREIIPLECSFGWPIPVEYHGKLYIKVFYYGVNIEGKGKAAIRQPYVEFTIDYITKKVVAFSYITQDSKYSDVLQEGTIGYFPHEAIRKMSAKKYKEYQIEAIQLLEAFFDNRSNGKSVSKSQALRLSELMNLIVSPCLIPYYKKLNNKFVTSILELKK